MLKNNMKQTKYQGTYITASEAVIGGHTYERVELMENVHVMPIRDKKILLINEYRNHERSARWKLITGWCDKENKTPQDHAIEELAEEVGMQAEIWEKFFSSATPNATVNINSHYFVCKSISELVVKIENPDTSKVLEYAWFGYSEIFDLINEGKMFPSGSTMVALWYLYSLEKTR